MAPGISAFPTTQNADKHGMEVAEPIGFLMGRLRKSVVPQGVETKRLNIKLSFLMTSRFTAVMKLEHPDLGTRNV